MSEHGWPTPPHKPLSDDMKKLIEFKLRYLTDPNLVVDMSDKRQEFLESINKQFIEKRWLSEAQIECLDRVYDEY
jgi:hypothetical protein